MRKIFTFFFALIVTANLWAYHDFKSGDCYYNILSNTPPYTIQVAQGWQIYEGSWAIIPYVGDIVIPDSVIYNNICYKVVAIQDLIFANCPALTSVKVGNNIRIISKHCFANNPRLKKVFLPESITTIGEEAFAYCDSLQTINIPSGLTSVGQNIFKSSPQLDTVIWNLRNADLNITPLKSNKAISVVTIGDSVTTIGESAFYGCTNLSEVYWGKQLKTIGKSAFSGSGIHSAILPEGIDSIASSAFSSCSKLKVVSIPSSLRYVNGWDHFDNTESFNSSNNIDSVYWNAYNCVENRPFNSTQNGLIRVVEFSDSIKHIPNRFCMSFSNLTNVILPKGLQSIGKEAFEQCKKLSNVEIPDSVTTIGESAFYGCTNLSEVYWGKQLKTIGKSAFSGSGIHSAILPEGIDSIASSAFSSCSKLKVVSIPSSLRYVNGWDHFDNTESFNSSNNIDSVYWNAYNCVENRPFNSTQNGLIRVVEFSDSIKHIPNRFCMSFSNLTNVILPKGLQSIGKEAFEQCKKLSNVEIPDSVTTIGESAFYGCTNLSEVYWGKQLKTIGKSAFSGSGIHSAILPEGIDSIASSAFSSCSKLKVVSIPSSLRYVNGWDHFDNTESFNSSNNIDSVYWNAYNCVENRPFNSTQNGLIRVVEFSDSIKHIPNRFCMSFSNLTNVILPKGLQSIGKEAFEQCKKLSNVEIPDSVTTIGEEAFYGCSNLSKVSLGCTLNSIGKSAFYSKKLTTVICNAVIPPTLGSNAFHTSTITFVYIPCGTSDAYKASAWKDYCKNFVEPELEFTLNIYTSDTTQGIVTIDQYPTCSNDTVKFHAVPTSMYQFAQWSDGNKDNPRKLVLTQDTSLIAMFQINYIQPDMVTLCYGDTYQWNDKVYDSTGVYVDTLSNGVATLYLTILPAAVIETEALALCPSELPYEWYGQSITEAGLYTATEQYAAGCDSILHELTLDVYLQTLPEQVTLPVVHQGEAIDVTIPTAEVQAHIAAETWYAPNALVEWYMQTLAGWEVLTTEPIKNGTSQIVLKYAVNSDCGSVESQGMIISVLTTGVENLPNGKTSPQKLIRDGQLLIMRDGKTYNAQGAAL